MENQFSAILLAHDRLPMLKQMALYPCVYRHHQMKLVYYKNGKEKDEESSWESVREVKERIW